MDNQINEIRKQIRLLRLGMLDVEASMREQINLDLDCAEPALRLMAMRAQMVGLVERRAALGDCREPIEVDRLVQPRRAAEVRKPRGVSGRR